MKKKLFFLLTLVALLALSLLACSPASNTPGGNKTNDAQKDGWKEIQSPNMTDVYTKFLGGFTSIAGEFTKSRLKTSPRVSTDGLFKLSVNDNVFWGDLRFNYNNITPKTAMLSFELCKDDNDDAGDVVLGAYLYEEKVYLQIGTTKFSLDLKASDWAGFFPLNDIDASLDKVALFLSTVIVTSKDTVGKSRMNGLYEEYKYSLEIDLARSLQNLLSGDISGSDLQKYGIVISSLVGVGVDEIKNGDFPKSSLKIDFTTFNMKLSALCLDLHMDEIKNQSGTILGDDKLNLTVDVKELNVGKENVSVPFVLDANAQNRQSFIYYRDNAFKLNFDTDIVAPDGNKQYVADIKAKVFQPDNLNNYVFVELKNPATQKAEEGLYVYKNIAYLFTTEEDRYVCKVSMPLDLSEIATKTVNNDFYPDTVGPEVIDALGYVMKNLKVGNRALEFKFDSDFYKYVWFNMNDMLKYIDELFAESIYDIEAVKKFVALTTKYSANLKFDYDEEFILIVPDGDRELTDITNMLSTAEAAITLSSAVSDDNTEDAGE